MRKFILVLNCFVLFNLFTKAQTTYFATQISISNQHLWSVYFTDTNTGYAVGNNGTIVKTTNSGLNWIPQTSGVNEQLFSVFFINANIGWAVGSSCTILKTLDGGAVWTSQNSGLSDDHFFSVHFTDDKTGYIATQTGTILKTIDGGNTWVKQINQRNPFLFSIEFVNANTGFAVGGTGFDGNKSSSMKILKTSDGGANWSVLSNGITDGVLLSANFVNSSIGFAVGIKSNGSSTILKTVDGGLTWTEKVLPSKYCLRSVYFVDANNGFCCGDGGLTYRTTDGGNTWVDISDPLVKNQGLYSIFFINQNLGWQIGSNGKLIRYTSTAPIISIPSISTTAVTSITQNSATSGGIITSDGGAPVITRGVCWSLSVNPTVANSKTVDGTGIGTFSSSITGLSPNTKYYVRAYATNSAGTAYGNEIIFTTGAVFANCGTVTDIDGNTYNTVTIGTQCWMQENLKTTKYRDGNSISNITDAVTWGNLTTGAYCWYDNDATKYKATYGALYNWYTVNNNNLCPAGWHIPTDSEWYIVEEYIDPTITDPNVIGWRGTVSGIKLRTQNGWYLDKNGTDAYGFSALPAGIRNLDGSYSNAIDYTSWWSTTENNESDAWYRGAGAGIGGTSRMSFRKQLGHSIRCIKDVFALATISTLIVNNISTSTAKCGGNISADGGSPIISHGVCWSTSVNPTIANSKTLDGAGIGTFSSSITGLSPNTKYYVRAYATNSAGTAYGNEISFTTIAQTTFGQPCPDLPTVTDVDGNVYNTVQIDGQCWLKENLKVIHYTDGSLIPSNLSNNEWKNDRIGAYSIYPYSQVSGVNSDAEMLNNYGALYNWFVVNDSRGVCPTGWEVPSYEQWNDLVLYLDPIADLNNSNQSNIAGGKLKDKSTAPQSHPRWDSPNANATNETGFSAFPGGDRYEGGDFMQNGTDGRFWSSTSYSSCCSWAANLGYFSGSFTRIGSFKNHGYSIRCIKKSTPVSITHTLTLAINPALSGTASGGGDYEVGKQVNITATPANDYQFVNWTIGADVISSQSNYSYTMANSNITITANFEKDIKVDGQPCPGVPTITDIDGNTYNTVLIGNQCWLKENLKVTKYNDGTAIPASLSASLWGSNAPEYSIYPYAGIIGLNSRADMVAAFGLLYNWYAMADNRGLCPSGWHVSTNTDWDQLSEYILASQTEFDKNEIGNSLKSCRQINSPLGGDCKTSEQPRWEWYNSDIYGTDRYGFSALPAGRITYYGSFSDLGYSASWWAKVLLPSSVSEQVRGMSSIHGLVTSSSADRKNGFSVRCVKGGITLATISTSEVTNISSSTATSGGNITSDGGTPILSRGVCLSTLPNPTISNIKTIDGADIGVFSSSITGLLPNTKYYLRAYVTNGAGTAYGEEVSFTTQLNLEIGQEYQGGIIAYIFKPGDPCFISGEVHGLIASKNDLSCCAIWYDGNYIITNAKGIELCTGSQNTTNIIKKQGPSKRYAANLCRDYNGGGYNDWFLPSIDELDKLRINKDIIGGFGGVLYWTSTERSSDSVWCIEFKDGVQHLISKFFSCNLRAVRYF